MENELISYSLDEAQKKFRTNPLLYLTIVLGIVGILFPLLGWFMQSHKIEDLDELRLNLDNIQKSYKKVNDTIDKIMQEHSYRWKLSDYDRKLLKKLSQEKRNAFIEFLGLLYFLMQGSFFLFLGILLERKVFFPRRMQPKTKQKKEESPSEKKPQEEENKKLSEMEQKESTIENSNLSSMSQESDKKGE